MAKSGFDRYTPELLKDLLLDKERSEALARKHHGWTVWTTRRDRTPVATRSSDQKPPANAGEIGWAQTLIGEGKDPWADLESQLDAQPQAG